MHPNHTTSNHQHSRKSYAALEDAFFAHLAPGAWIDCWLWPDCTTKNGYGLFTFQNKKYYAHRVAYEIYNGPIPQGLDVLHHCDTPGCCNAIFCLWLGTAKDNALDMVAKGRNGYRAFIGEQHHSAKLNVQQVREIRCLAESGMDQSEIGRMFGVSQTTVTQIKCRRVWAHVE